MHATLATAPHDTADQHNMDRFLEQHGVPFERHAPLAPLTWYGVGGPARWLVKPASHTQLAALVAHAHQNRVPIYLLGAGANLLVADEGIDGIVIKLDHAAFRDVKIDGTRVTVGAGHDLPKLINQLARAGLAGLECLAGVPATLGGAVRMNAGGAFGEIGTFVAAVTVMQHDGSTQRLQRSDIVFAYRKTSIAAPYILEIELALTTADPAALRARVREIMDLKTASQPFAAHSAGCTFKNPPPAPDGRKRPAGMLIDQAGLKGFRVGGAHVSAQHANFVVADEGAKAADILAVIRHVETTIEQRHGIKLEREVVVWP